MEQNRSNTALLVMDMQAAILKMVTDVSGLIDNTLKAIATARERNMPVIYVTVGYRPGMPEVSPNNKGGSAAKVRFANLDMAEFVKIEPALEPAPDDIIVLKRRISAFSGSDLEVVLRAQGISRLVLTGVATSGVVLSTVREAADKDYWLTVLSDCCADADPEVHRVLTTKIFPRQADVMTVEEWVKG